MDEQIREYLVMAFSATAISVVLLLITVSLLDYREYGPYVSVAIGMVAGLAILLVRRRRLFIAFEKNLCEKLRDVSSILSFMAMPPATAVVVMKLAYSDLNADDLVVISAILVIISMIVQAVFWKYAQDVGYLTFADIIMLVISLILMNVASILSFDRASGIMTVVGIVTAILPVLMMYDWQWTVKIVLIGLLACGICGTGAMVIQDDIVIGHILTFFIPLLFIFLISFRLAGTFLMYEGRKLF